DAESERDDDGDGEPWLEAEAPQCVSKILRECAPPLGASRLPDAVAIDTGQPFARAFHVAESPLGFSPRVVRIHAVGHELPHRHVEMEPQLVVDRAVDRCTAAVDMEKSAETRKARHRRYAISRT